MFGQIMRWVLGAKLETNKLSEEKFSVFWGLPILASDAISSVAYAVEEILWVLLPVIGLGTYIWMPKIAMTIIFLLVILTLSYRQIVDAYPNGGGAYIVAKENLKTIYGLIVGASLSVDYTLTVAVSICAGTAAITSAFPELFPHRIVIAVVIIALMVIGNLRGVKESARVFSLPTYAFMISIIALIITGIYKYHSGGYVETVSVQEINDMTFGTEALSIFLLLRAFSSGCAAVTGVEAICDAVPHFKPPAQNNAKISYMLLLISVAVTFGGIAYLAKIFQAVPNPEQTVIAQLSLKVFGDGTMFYIMQGTTAIILAMAANTAFTGFPTLLSIIAQDRYAPRQLTMRGHRLNYSNGILTLAFFAILLVVSFEADTHLLIPLYAVGVFLSFTLAQLGMLFRWFRQKPSGWKFKALINGIGALITLLTVVIIGITKFTSGAWIVFIVVPILVYLMGRIRVHYDSIIKKLDVTNSELPQKSIEINAICENHIIIPIDSLNLMVINAIKYAKSLSSNVEAFHVEIFPGASDKLRKKWDVLNPGIPLTIKPSPYRDIVGSLVEYIDSEEHKSKPGDVITVLLPQFFVTKWWHTALHNNTSIFIANALFHRHNVVISIIPFYLDEDLDDKKYQF